MNRNTRFSRAHFSVLLGVISATGLSGCGGNYGCGAGFAQLNSALEVTNVTDSRTGVAITHIVLSDIHVNGTAVTDVQSLVSAQFAHGVTIVGNTLECDVPCDFGISGGTYQFTVSASSYKSAVKEFAGGALFNGDPCPTSTVGSTKIKFTLDPQ